MEHIGMTCQVDARADRHGKELVRVERDRIGTLDTGQHAS
jgi:hypothetical protein